MGGRGAPIQAEIERHVRRQRPDGARAVAAVIDEIVRPRALPAELVAPPPRVDGRAFGIDREQIRALEPHLAVITARPLRRARR